MSAAVSRLRVSTYALALAWLVATVTPDLAPALLAGVAFVLAASLAGRTARRVVVPAHAPVHVAIHGHDRARRATVVRLADPDAPGRPRPRAPGHLSAA
jgi:hypothetical protein